MRSGVGKLATGMEQRIFDVVTEVLLWPRVSTRELCGVQDLQDPGQPMQAATDQREITAPSQGNGRLIPQSAVGGFAVMHQGEMGDERRRRVRHAVFGELLFQALHQVAGKIEECIADERVQTRARR